MRYEKFKWETSAECGVLLGEVKHLVQNDSAPILTSILMPILEAENRARIDVKRESARIGVPPPEEELARIGDSGDSESTILGKRMSAVRFYPGQNRLRIVLTDGAVKPGDSGADSGSILGRESNKNRPQNRNQNRSFRDV